MATLPPSIRWDGKTLHLLDQTQLPLATVIEPQETLEQVWDAIKRLKVRGAPAIGIAGAYGLLLGLQGHRGAAVAQFLETLHAQAEYLDSARPTAVNLRWALQRLVTTAKDWLTTHPEATADHLWQALEREAIALHEEDRQLCAAIGRHGLPLIRPEMGILTHCNAGALATAGLGTALAPLYLAHQQGIPFRVYADETRPLLQGARLTSWELHQSGINVTVICDNMAPHLMGQGLVDLVVVGTDRVAANGDVANKIGTLGVAIAAHHFGIPFYVACPYSTIDFATPNGAAIPIEERDAQEVNRWGDRPTALPTIPVRNPAFDVTPHTLVTGIITDRGLLHPPYTESLRQAYAP